ncbi:MAG: DnaJ domain-containing protein [Gammaproteobacteria bacterium]|nr:DnaJ domain-containing protein [Gammaproteobacteria bacterium]
MEFKDYYQIMGINRDASQGEIKRAYRKLARKYHPDVSKEADAELRFKELGEAYEVLKDPEKRAAYNQLGKNWKAGQEFDPPPEWDQGFEFHGGGFTGADAEQFSDFFESLFGHGGFSHGATDGFQQQFDARGQDTHAKILISLDDAFHGATRAISIKHTELDQNGQPRLKERTLNVHIPKGVRQGQHIRLAKQGAKGLGNVEAGDLFLEIEFQAHPFYQVEGKNIFLKCPLAPWEAMLGAMVKLPTPTGKIDLKIPPNSSNGQKLRLKGRGIPAREPGDLYAVLEIALPQANDEKTRQAYLDMKQKFNFNPRATLGV